MGEPMPSGSGGDELYAACEEGDWQRVQELAQHGCDVTHVHRTEGGWDSGSSRSALTKAVGNRPSRWRNGTAETKWKSIEVPEEEYQHEHTLWSAAVQALLQAKADPNFEESDYDWRGCGSSQSAFESAIGVRGGNVDMELLRAFLEAGADVNKVSVSKQHSMRTDGCERKCLLHSVVKSSSQIEVAEALLEAKADVDAVATHRMNNERGWGENTVETPLHIAARRAGPDAWRWCALLLSHGAHPNTVRQSLDNVHVESPDPMGDPRAPGFVPGVRLIPVRATGLHQALLARNPSAVQLCVIWGADPEIEYNYGDEMRQTETLCDGEDAEALQQALRYEWSIAAHPLYQTRTAFAARVAALALVGHLASGDVVRELLGTGDILTLVVAHLTMRLDEDNHASKCHMRKELPGSMESEYW